MKLRREGDFSRARSAINIFTTIYIIFLHTKHAEKAMYSPDDVSFPPLHAKISRPKTVTVIEMCLYIFHKVFDAGKRRYSV